MNHPELQILLYGEDISSSEVTLEGKGIHLKETFRPDNPNYLLVYLDISQAQAQTFQIRLKGKGIVSMKNPSVHGDQYVTVQIEVPRHLTPQAKEKLREYEVLVSGNAKSA